MAKSKKYLDQSSGNAGMTSPGSDLVALRKRGFFVCEYCGVTFEDRANPPPRFCCPSHRAAAWNKANKPKRKKKKPA